MSTLAANDYRFISARRRQADAIVKLMNDAPKLDGESFWHSIALHLLDAGYSKQPTVALGVAVWGGESK